MRQDRITRRDSRQTKHPYSGFAQGQIRQTVVLRALITRYVTVCETKGESVQTRTLISWMRIHRAQIPGKRACRKLAGSEAMCGHCLITALAFELARGVDTYTHTHTQTYTQEYIIAQRHTLAPIPTHTHTHPIRQHTLTRLKRSNKHTVTACCLVISHGNK